MAGEQPGSTLFRSGGCIEQLLGTGSERTKERKREWKRKRERKRERERERGKKKVLGGHWIINLTGRRYKRDEKILSSDTSDPGAGTLVPSPSSFIFLFFLSLFSRLFFFFGNFYFPLSFSFIFLWFILSSPSFSSSSSSSSSAYYPCRYLGRDMRVWLSRNLK